MSLIETHAHLDFPDFAPELDDVIARAHAAGVSTLITIGSSSGIQSARNAVALAEKYPSIYATVGQHPVDAENEMDWSELESFLSHPKVVAVGETGLDYHWKESTPEKQKIVFARQIALAQKCKKPLVIHSRLAGSDCLELLTEHNAKEVGGVFHCYGEDASFAQKLVEIGFLVSFTGVVTFKKADALREIVRDIPLTQIMVETDCPYMSPEPYRGKRAEPAYVREIATMIAKVKGVSFEEVARVTSENAKRLFKL